MRFTVKGREENDRTSRCPKPCKHVPWPQHFRFLRVAGIRSTAAKQSPRENATRNIRTFVSSLVVSGDTLAPAPQHEAWCWTCVTNSTSVANPPCLYLRDRGLLVSCASGRWEVLVKGSIKGSRVSMNINRVG